MATFRTDVVSFSNILLIHIPLPLSLRNCLTRCIEAPKTTLDNPVTGHGTPEAVRRSVIRSTWTGKLEQQGSNIKWRQDEGLNYPITFIALFFFFVRLLLEAC
jgi:hypothetical protein